MLIKEVAIKELWSQSNLLCYASLYDCRLAGGVASPRAFLVVVYSPNSSISPQLSSSPSVPRHSSPALTASTASSGVSAATASATVLTGAMRKTAVSPRNIPDDLALPPPPAPAHFRAPWCSAFIFRLLLLLNKMTTVRPRCCLLSHTHTRLIPTWLDP